MDFEKRHSPRNSIRYVTGIREMFTGHFSAGTAMVRNFSSGGLLLKTLAPPSPDSLLLLEFALFPVSRPVYSMVRVQRAHRVQGKGHCLVGGEFVKFTLDENNTVTGFFSDLIESWRGNEKNWMHRMTASGASGSLY